MEIRAKHKGITGREIFEASKSAIKNRELLDQAQKAIRGDIEHQRIIFDRLFWKWKNLFGSSTFK